MDEALNVREIAAYLQLDSNTVYRLANEGKLPMFRVGSAWRARLKDLDRWMEQECHGPCSPRVEDTRSKLCSE